MKKKHVLLMCALLTFSLTACGGEEKATVTNTTNAKQEVEVQELENEVDSQEEADGSTQEETVTSSEDESDENSETVDKEESLLDQEALSEMLTGFIDWSGFQYLETPIEVDTLTGKQAIPMAAHVVAFFNNDLEQTTEGQMVIPKELLDDTMIQYFGKTFDVSEVGDLEEETSRITLDENGNAIVNPNMTRAEMLPSIRKLYAAVEMALLQMEALSKQ